jgi:hypothetical protein
MEMVPRKTKIYHLDLVACGFGGGGHITQSQRRSGEQIDFLVAVD